jgi:pyridoxal phosphate enzyme (YggS family)
VSANLAENLALVRERIAASAARSGHDPSQVTIVAVTKTFPVERIREALAAGLQIFGENRVQEAVPKIDAIGRGEVAWHLIGHLQSNKARFIEGRFAMVQSIDSVGIVETLGRRLHKPLDILIEVNVAAEPQKTGALELDLDGIVAAIERYPALKLRGLMTVAPMSQESEAVRPVFRKLRALRDATAARLGRSLPVLSMGMTDDYDVAVEEGATMLRLGRAIFGAR